MAGAKDPWFVIERSEALAGLLLTSRPDVRVREEHRRDDGVDILAEINTGEALPTRVFVVQVKGTTSSTPADWMENVKHLFGPYGSAVYLPVCVFVVNVRDNRAAYAWVAEPSVSDRGAGLRFHEQPTFQNLDATAVGQVVDRVKVWYDALPHQLQPV